MMGLERTISPLDDIKVLDMSHLGPGMFCTMILGDYGADVISVCSPNVVKISQNADEEDFWSYKRQLKLMQDSLSRNKKSVMLDLKSEEGRKVFLNIAAEMDVIVEDFRPGALKRLGLDYENIREINKKIIYCSLTGYGQNGPYRDLPGHDINYAGMAGALGLIGELDGPPVVPMYFLADLAGAALHASIGILLALLARSKTGIGQSIDISFVDTLMTLLTPLAHAQLNEGFTARRGETLYSGSFPCYSVYKCADGKYISIGCFEPWVWNNLCGALSLEKFVPYQFAGGKKKVEVFSSLQARFLSKTRDQWFDLLREKNVCVGKVYSLDEVFMDPQVMDRKIVQEIKDRMNGVLRYLGPTIKLEKTPGQIRISARKLGEDTDEIVEQFKNKK